MKSVSCVVFLILIAACSDGPEPTAIRLVDQFDLARVRSPQQPASPGVAAEWRFDASLQTPTGGFWSVNDVRGLRIEDGALMASTGENPILAVETPDTLDPGDELHAIEIRMRASAGERLSVQFAAELEPEVMIDTGSRYSALMLAVSLVPGDDIQTYTLTSAASNFEPSFPFARMSYIFIKPTDVADADIAIESVKLVSRKEHLASIASGIGWQGLSDVYRETIVTRTPEAVAFEVELPSKPFLDISFGTIEPDPVTFRVSMDADVLMERTITRSDRWESLSLDLAAHAGEKVQLTLETASSHDGRLGYWGSPVIRNRGGAALVADASPARSTLAKADPPRGVILIVADTLRRDHFQPYGYERDNAPVLTAFASEGVRFADNISQGTWTKVAVSSMLTSLYPSTHGVSAMHHRVPASVTTLAEAYNQAGYATFGVSSVPFTGKLSNLHQGLEVLHERASIDELDPMSAKTARPYVDRLLPWLEAHADVPFFAFLHVFDAHSPFRPEPPYDTTWIDPDGISEHETQVKGVKDYVDVPIFRAESLATTEDLARAGIDPNDFVTAQKAWYDGSILAMDAEIGRVLERLRELGLEDDVVVAFIGDHGEEFLEHGRPFHGLTAYGEMLNVPLILWGPGFLPKHVVERTTQSIDLMPTLLDLSRLPVPEALQGQSLLPLLVGGTRPEALGYLPRPAFAERETDGTDGWAGREVESVVVIADGWKLIKNSMRPDGWPEYELFDHAKDPLNLDNLAEKHQDVVERLGEVLDNWHRSALAARVDSDSQAEGLSTEERERLRSLGYIQ